jgi:hypothetical protein
MQERHEDYMKRRSNELREQFGLEPSIDKPLEVKVDELKSLIWDLQKKLDEVLKRYE